MRLLLIRHAQSSNNKSYLSDGNDSQRVPDPQLSELGKRQADALAQQLRQSDYPTIDVLYCSLMSRTIQTAIPIAETFDLDITAHGETFEFGGPYLGSYAERRPWPGASRSELAASSARLILPESATETGWWHQDCETQPQATVRASRVYAQLQAEHPDQVVALVSHGVFGSLLIQAAIGSTARFELDNTATTLIDTFNHPTGLFGTTVSVGWLNRTDHFALL